MVLDELVIGSIGPDLEVVVVSDIGGGIVGERSNEYCEVETSSTEIGAGTCSDCSWVMEVSSMGANAHVSSGFGLKTGVIGGGVAVEVDELWATGPVPGVSSVLVSGWREGTSCAKTGTGASSSCV